MTISQKKRKKEKKIRKAIKKDEFNKEEFKKDYFSLKNDNLCVKYGISHNTLRRLAKQEGWEKPHGRPEIKLV